MRPDVRSQETLYIYISFNSCDWVTFPFPLDIEEECDLIDIEAWCGELALIETAAVGKFTGVDCLVRTGNSSLNWEMMRSILNLSHHLTIVFLLTTCSCSSISRDSSYRSKESYIWP